jgi:hypothetical protein
MFGVHNQSCFILFISAIHTLVDELYRPLRQTTHGRYLSYRPERII